MTTMPFEKKNRKTSSRSNCDSCSDTETDSCGVDYDSCSCSDGSDCWECNKAPKRRKGKGKSKGKLTGQTRNVIKIVKTPSSTKVSRKRHPRRRPSSSSSYC